MNGKSDHIPDQELIRMIQCGDPEESDAINLVEARNKPATEGIYMNFGALKNRPQLKEDVYQKTRIGFSSAARREVRKSLDGLWVTIFRHKAIDTSNEAERRTQREPTWTDYDPEGIKLGQIDLQEEKTEDDRLDKLVKAMEKLPPRQLQVFELYYFENIGKEAIAELLNLTEGTVNQTLQAARDNLRKSWNEE